MRSPIPSNVPFLAGVIAKVGAFFTTIPDCVLGGMTTFLFANVLVSGIKILSFTKLARRDRFILAISLGAQQRNACVGWCRYLRANRAPGYAARNERCN